MLVLIYQFLSRCQWHSHISRFTHILDYLRRARSKRCVSFSSDEGLRIFYFWQTDVISKIGQHFFHSFQDTARNSTNLWVRNDTLPSPKGQRESNRFMKKFLRTNPLNQHELHLCVAGNDGEIRHVGSHVNENIHCIYETLEHKKIRSTIFAHDQQEVLHLPICDPTACIAEHMKF